MENTETMETSVHHNSSEFDTISNFDLSPAQTQVIVALAQGRTVSDAARDAGIHRSTIYNWFRHQPTFQAAFEDARREYVETVHEGMRELASYASVASLMLNLDEAVTKE